jgi:serine/threonine protein kinase
MAHCATTDVGHPIHSHSVIHWDLKTENVLLDSDFYPHVANLGLSKIMPMGEEQVKKAVQMTMGVGTLRYVAPELFEEGTDPYTTAVDVYAYGMFLYELCTAVKPFEKKGEEKRFVLSNHIVDGL